MSKNEPNQLEYIFILIIGKSNYNLRVRSLC